MSGPYSVIRVSVLLFNDGSRWMAQGLEYDFVASGSTIRKAMDAFTEAFAGQICLDVKNGNVPLSGFGPAPAERWNQFQDGVRFAESRLIPLPDDLVASGSHTGIPNLVEANDLRVFA